MIIKREKNKFWTIISKFVKRLIGWIFSFFIILIFIGIVRHPHFDIYSISNGLFIILLITAFFLLFYYNCSNDNFKRKISLLFKKNNLVLTFVFLGLVFVYQIVLVLKTHTTIGFDVQAIYSELNHPGSESAYFNLNPNNLFIFLVEKNLSVLTGLKPTWLNLDFFSLFCTDLSMVINFFTIRKWDKRAAFSSIFLQGIFLIFFPMIIVPYTDTLVLPLVSFMFYFYTLLKKNNSYFKKILFSSLLGLDLALTYLMKPSAIIPIVAVVIVEVFISYKGKSFISLKKIIIMFCFLSFSIATISIFNVYKNEQSFVTIKKDGSEPVAHFIAMGMVNGGGYYGPDVEATANMKNVKARSVYSQRLIKERLKSFGVAGYLKFLVYKNYNNTANGSFGWGEEGNFIVARPLNKLQEFFFLNGNRVNDYFWTAQFIWLLFILFILFGNDFVTDFSYVLRLSILGGLFFLLIFEGGRSRYLIQFLPAFFLMLSLSFRFSIRKIKDIILVYRKRLKISRN